MVFGMFIDVRTANLVTLSRCELKKKLFQKIKDGKDGVLYVAETKKQIPFPIKRVYFIDKVKPHSLRGCHAHKKLEQVMFSLRGKFHLTMYDGKRCEQMFVEQGQGVRIPPLVWHSMTLFDEDCLMCVFASDYYNEKDYIRNFHEFKKVIQ